MTREGAPDLDPAYEASRPGAHTCDGEQRVVNVPRNLPR